MSADRHGNVPLALFDLDGTLLDSAPDIAAAVNHALTVHGRPALAESEVRGFIGNGAAALVHRAITGDVQGRAEAMLFERVYAEFEDAYAARLFVRSRVYPGVPATLGELTTDGWRLACITNKPARFTTPLLAAAGLDDRFDVVVSGDSLPARKPDAAPVLHALRVLGGVRERSVLIGDSLTDVVAARNAGVACVGVSYGYRGGVDLARHGAVRVVDRVDQLPAVLAEVRASLAAARKVR